jgi:hypothetical protein
MKTVKDLLLSELTSEGFIYYPEIKRLMHKIDNTTVSEVIVVEMNQDNTCRVYFSKDTNSNNVSQISEDKFFDYDFEKIITYINALPTDMVSNNTISTNKFSNIKTAA